MDGKKIGIFTALVNSLLAVVTFGIAIFTPPITGPFCQGTCIEYPFTNIISRFPRDYIWMYPAILLTLFFVMMMASIHIYASREKKIFSLIGLLFSVISATALIFDYFIQISVIQPSLLNGETGGIAMLTQYNPHGIFIALEEIGYILMSVALVAVFPVFSGKTWLESMLRSVLISGFIITLISLIIITSVYGIKREYRFEVTVITINYLALIISGILLSLIFRKSK